MDYLEFKEKVSKEYEKLNESMWIKVDVPSDQELLMQFLTWVIMAKHEREVMAKYDRSRRD